MTLSILTFDMETGVFAAAAATGNLCVGGWVLRGDIESGIVASQGTSPSTFWRDDIMRDMYEGKSSRIAIDEATNGDPGKDFRQVAAIDKNGLTAAHTGTKSVQYADHLNTYEIDLPSILTLSGELFLSSKEINSCTTLDEVINEVRLKIRFYKEK